MDSINSVGSSAPPCLAWPTTEVVSTEPFSQPFQTTSDQETTTLAAVPPGNSCTPHMLPKWDWMTGVIRESGVKGER